MFKKTPGKLIVPSLLNNSSLGQAQNSFHKKQHGATSCPTGNMKQNCFLHVWWAHRQALLPASRPGTYLVLNNYMGGNNFPQLLLSGETPVIIETESQSLHCLLMRVCDQKLTESCSQKRPNARLEAWS